jgi:hypothetical protein
MRFTENRPPLRLNRNDEMTNDEITNDEMTNDEIPLYFSIPSICDSSASLNSSRRSN